MFHVELRQRPHVARAFNLSAEELSRRFVAPLRAGRIVSYAEREWSPRKTKLTILEGPALAPEEMGLDRGWSNATRRGSDVTERMLSAEPPAVERPAEVNRLKERILGRLTAGPQSLLEVVTMADELLPGARPSQRLSLAELSVWELLHEGAVKLAGANQEIDRASWESLLLSWETWRQATTSSISLARSGSDANR